MAQKYKIPLDLFNKANIKPEAGINLTITTEDDEKIKVQVKSVEDKFAIVEKNA